MTPVQTALTPDFSKVPVVTVKQQDGSTINEYQFAAYITGGRYKVGPKQWDVRAWNVFTPEQYTPFVVAPTKSSVSLPMTAVAIAMQPGDLCTQDQATRLTAELAKDIGRGTVVSAVPYGVTGVANWDPDDARRYWEYQIEGRLGVPLGQILQKRMAQGVNPDGWGAPGHWTLNDTTPVFTFDPPAEPVAKPTDWIPSRLMTPEEQANFMSEPSGDVILDATDSPNQAGRGDFTPEDRARAIHIEQMLEQLIARQ